MILSFFSPHSYREQEASQGPENRETSGFTVGVAKTLFSIRVQFRGLILWFFLTLKSQI